MSSRCAGSPSEKEGSHLAGIAQGSGCTRKSAAEAEASPARRRSTARARWQRATTHNSCKSLPCTWDTSCPVRTATDPETWRRNFGGFSLPCPCALKDQRLEAQALAGAYGSSVQVGPLHLSIRCCSRCRSVARLRQALRPPSRQGQGRLESQHRSARKCRQGVAQPRYHQVGVAEGVRVFPSRA